MEEQEPGRGYGGGRSWVKWLIIYLLIGGVIYLGVWFFFFRNGYGG
jgi:hypothetical protein